MNLILSLGMKGMIFALLNQCPNSFCMLASILEVEVEDHI